MELNGKIAIVTGASSGIGLAAARLLAQKGVKVALVSRSKEKLAAISKTIPNSIFFTADMTKEKDIRQMVKKVETHFGRIDILMNNAGQGYDAMVEKIDLPTMRALFELDVVGPLYAMQQVIPLMRKTGGGAIVNISSGTALMHLKNMAAYSSLKRALVGISLTAHEELEPDNISVSVVYPYITSTDFEKNTIKGPAIAPGPRERTAPFKADTPEHVAQCIVDGIMSGEPEIYAHAWMGKMAAGK